MPLRTEDFSGTAGVMPNPPWTQANLDGVSCTVNRDGSGLGTTVGTNSVADTLMFDNTTTYNNDQIATIAIVALGSITMSYVIACVRCSIGTGFSGYTAYTDGGAGSTHSGMSKYVNGTQTLLGETAPTFANGDVVGIKVTGTSIQMLKNGTVVQTNTDSSLTSGSIGGGSNWYASGTRATFDNLTGDNLLSAALSGTITSATTEADIVAGGKTIIITLTGDRWIAI